MATKPIKVRKGAGWNCDELVVVGSGKLAYVWIGLNDACRCNFSGPKTLRKLATQILKALADRPKAKGRRCLRKKQ